MTASTGADACAMAAARARLRGFVHPAEAASLDRLDERVWRVVDRRGDERRATVLTHPAEYAIDTSCEAAATLSPLRSQVLLAVLAATRDGAGDHPWPGRPTTVEAVLELLGGARIPPGRLRHLRAAFGDLASAGLIELPDHDPADTPTGDTTVLVGPAVAAWEGPWVDDVDELAAEVAASAGRHADGGGRR